VMRTLDSEGASPLIIVLVVVVVLAIVGTVIWFGFLQPSGDSAEEDDEFRSLAVCTAECMEDFEDVFDAMVGLLHSVDNPSAQAWTNVYYSWTSGQFSLNRGSGTWIKGVVSPGMNTNLSRGLYPTQSAAARWNRTVGSEVTATGGFGFTELTEGKFRMTIIENTSIFKDVDRYMDFTTFGLHINLTTAQQGHPYQTVFVSQIEFVTHLGTATLTGLMAVGYEFLQATGSYKGEPYEFHIDLDDFQVTY